MVESAVELGTQHARGDHEVLLVELERVPDPQRPTTVPVPEVLALGEMFGKALAKPTEAITPKQARDLGIDATVIDAYAERPRGALRLEPVDDNAAKLAFE